VPYEIRWDQKAREFLRTLDPQIAQQIIKKANNIVDFPEHYLEYLVEIRFYEEPTACKAGSIGSFGNPVFA